MTNIETDFAFVNEQVSFHEKQAKVHAADAYRRKKHTETAERFKQLRASIESLDAGLKSCQEQLLASLDVNPTVRAPRTQMALSAEDIKDLPDDLLKELSLNAADHTEFAIVSLLNESGGILSLDRLLIGLYKKTKEIHKRQSLVQRLYRMAQKGLVFTVPGKKGIYSTRELTDKEAERMFSGVEQDELFN